MCCLQRKRVIKVIALLLSHEKRKGEFFLKWRKGELKCFSP